MINDLIYGTPRRERLDGFVIAVLRLQLRAMLEYAGEPSARNVLKLIEEKRFHGMWGVMEHKKDEGCLLAALAYPLHTRSIKKREAEYQKLRVICNQATPQEYKQFYFRGKNVDIYASGQVLHEKFDDVMPHVEIFFMRVSHRYDRGLERLEWLKAEVERWLAEQH